LISGDSGGDVSTKDLTTPDVPIDAAYMGVEKEVQKNMPAINDEYLKQVKQNREKEKVPKSRKSG
jgi:hypothetical protein